MYPFVTYKVHIPIWHESLK